MVRKPFVDENGLKRGAWSVEEDNKLRSYIQRYGHWNWRELPRFAGLARCGKSCRLRWINYLQPNIKHGCYTKEEEELIIKLHKQFGNRWSKIAKSLPGRTDNEVKNYWHTHLKKRVMHQQSTTNKMRKRTLTKKSQSETNSQVDDNSSSSRLNSSETNNLHILESCPISPQCNLSTTGSFNNLNLETLSSLTNDQYHHNNVEGEKIIEQTFSDVGSNNIGDTQSIGELMGDAVGPPFWSEPFFLENFQHYDDDANSNLIDEGLFSSPTLSSYWEMMDFSCIFDTDVNMQCRSEVETNYYW